MRSNTGAWKGSVLAARSGFSPWAGVAATAAGSAIGGSVAGRAQAPRARAIAEDSSRVRSMGWGSGWVGTRAGPAGPACAGGIRRSIRRFVAFRLPADVSAGTVAAVARKARDSSEAPLKTLTVL